MTRVCHVCVLRDFCRARVWAPQGGEGGVGGGDLNLG
nr:MAG TPA: hypothetical protein [Caudoviricetes sp.]